MSTEESETMTGIDCHAPHHDDQAPQKPQTVPVFSTVCSPDKGLTIVDLVDLGIIDAPSCNQLF